MAADPVDQLGLEVPQHWRTSAVDAVDYTLPAWWRVGHVPRQPTHVAFDDPDTGLRVSWSAREQRKGVHPTVHYADPTHRTAVVLAATPADAARQDRRSTTASVRFRLWAWEPWNISWWVAQIFFWGAWLFVVAASLRLWPVATLSPSDATLAATAVAFVSSVFFFLPGSYLLVVESLNASTTVKFGYAIDRRPLAVGAPGGEPVVLLRPLRHQSHHDQHPVGVRKRWLPPLRSYHILELAPAAPASDAHTLETVQARALAEPHVDQPTVPEPLDPALQNAGSARDRLGPGPPSTAAILRAPAASTASLQSGGPALEEHPFVWWGTRWGVVGYVAAVLIFAGSTLFAVSNTVGLVAHFAAMRTAVFITFFWAMELLASVCFVLAGLLYTREAQPAWNRPQMYELGWEASAWNLIGGLGFLATGICGFVSYAPSSQGSAAVPLAILVASLVGSLSFAIGSTFRLVEAVNRHVGSRHLAKVQERDLGTVIVA